VGHKISKRGAGGLTAAVLLAIAAIATVGGLGSAQAGPAAVRGAVALPSTCQTIHGGGKYTIVSDLPLQGASRFQTTQMTQAIDYVLKSHNYKAGKFSLTYASCDDATAQAGKYDPPTCASNANAYVRERSVLGVIGTFNSGCAQVEIPIANRASLSMVSPANSLVGLTQKGKSVSAGEPDKYYPTGKRNYTRVIASDNFQGAADAVLAKSLGVKKVYILNDSTSYGIGVATNFQGAAKADGIQVVGFEKWDPTASNFQSIMQKIAATKADAVFLGGITDSKGDQVIKDKVAVLGNNTKVKLLAPDGFAQTSTITLSGANNAEGMYMSASTLPTSQLKGPGKKFLSGFKKAQKISGDLQPYAIYAAQAAEVVYQAIAKSNGSRPSVTSALFKTNITNTILGTVKFNKNGDTASAKETIYVAKGGQLKVFKQITPPAKLVKAAA
jgi:branched-chain amino acid transport system substrate-binding protein